MLREEMKALKNATPRDLRKFGLMVGGVFILLALFFLWRHKPWWRWLLVVGMPLILGGLILPRGLRWVYVGWMTLAMALGAVVSTLLLTLLFYFVVTPLALLARLMGKDFLARRLHRGAGSYWIARDVSKPREKQAHERQF
jgi:hypothetical protein